MRFFVPKAVVSPPPQSLLKAELCRSAAANVLVPLRPVAIGLALLLPLTLAGCSRFHQKPADKYVYLTARQASLRDRVAAVSNRTGMAENGDRLVVLDRARRWVKVRTPRGETGWVEEKLTADQATADQFASLRQDHLKDPVVASAVTRDEVYLHAAPGRETDRFFLLAEGDPLNLISRATVAKKAAPGAQAAPKPVPKPLPLRNRAGVAITPEAVPEGPPAPVMEDWWLVRDKSGDTGWIYSRMIDVSEPDALARYSEGQRIVGAYKLADADDPDSGVLNNGQTVTQIPEYVTVLSPFKAGLPYDFDQVRVYTWNTKKHRYETAFRERNIAGYLPLQIGLKKDPYTKAPNAPVPLPGFTYRVLAADAPLPTPDAVTGQIKPGRTIAKTYRLEGNICRRILPPGFPPPAEAHPNPEPEKKAKGELRGRRR